MIHTQDIHDAVFSRRDELVNETLAMHDAVEKVMREASLEITAGQLSSFAGTPLWLRLDQVVDRIHDGHELKFDIAESDMIYIEKIARYTKVLRVMPSYMVAQRAEYVNRTAESGNTIFREKIQGHSFAPSSKHMSVWRAAQALLTGK